MCFIVYLCMYVDMLARIFKNKVMGNRNNRFHRTRFYVPRIPPSLPHHRVQRFAVVAFIARFILFIYFFFCYVSAWRSAVVGYKSRFRVQFCDHVRSLNNSFPPAQISVQPI